MRGRVKCAAIVTTVMFLAPSFCRAEDRPPTAVPPTTAPAAAIETLSLKLGKEIVLEAVKVPAGSFQMGGLVGWPNAMPKHEVTLTRDFYVGKFEVTQEQYELIMGKNPSRTKGPKNPVDIAPWDAAHEFCAKVSALTKRTVRLPTEAEWEYACRAGTTTTYSSGDDIESLKKVAWFSAGQADDKAETHPVGQLLPNPWGLYDMHGNVYEWCEDYLDEKFYEKSPKNDPVQKEPIIPAGRSEPWPVCRGGSAGSPATLCRTANRRDYSKLGKHTIGFRVVVEAEPAGDKK